MKGSPYDGANHPSAMRQVTDDLLYQTERTVVFRVAHGDGTNPLICKQPTGPRAAARLRHERRILERLRGVAGVVQSAPAPFPDAIAFEDLGATTLAATLRAGRMPLPAQLALMLQLTDIVAAVHRAGVMHKDLSPANILLIGNERRPLLIDFDLATTFAEERPGFIQPQEIAGTFPYIAPEQTGRTGRAVNPRADLYALGAVFYELIVGHAPFEQHRDDPLQLVYDILTQVPPAPAELDLQIPRGLSDIVLRLVEKEPDRRYQGAEGLKVDLLKLRDMLARGDFSTFPLGEHDYPLRLVPPSRLLGRATETALLQTAFDNALQGRGGCVLVSGVSGVGKSALINEMRSIVTARRGRYVAGKFDQFHPDTATAVVVQMLRALFRLVLAEPEMDQSALRNRVSAELGANAALMAGMVPELASFCDIAPENASGDPILVAKRLVQSALGLVRVCTSAQRPLVMVMDDVQWASAPVLDFIDTMLTDGNLPGLLLLGSYRDNEVDKTHPLSALQLKWERLHAPVSSIRLDNLPAADLAGLLAAMLHLPEDRAAELAEVIGLRTGGNPFDTVEFVNALRIEGILVLDSTGWHWDAVAIRRYVGRGDVIDLLQKRIARLPPGAGALMECMACLGGEVNMARFAAASGLPENQLEAELDPALEDGLIVAEGDDTVRFRHDRVQQSAYQGLAPERRAGLHLVIARRLTLRAEYRMAAAEQYLPALAAIDDAAEMAQAIGLFHGAARQAMLSSNYSASEHFLSAALALHDRLAQARGAAAVDLRQRAALEIDLHAALYSQGRLEEADAGYQRIESLAPDPLAMATAAGVQVNSLTNRGRPQEALTLGFALLERFGHSVPPLSEAQLPAQLDVLRSWVHEARRADELHASEEGGEPAAEVLAVSGLINRLMAPAMFADMKAMVWLSLESQRLWNAHGPNRFLVASLSCAGIVNVMLAQDYRGGYDIVRHIVGVGEAHGYELETVQARFLFVTSAAHWFEPFADTVARARRAHEGLVRAGDLQMDCWNHYQLIAASLECQPTLDDCTADIDVALGLAARVGNDYANAVFVMYRQLLRALRGETVALDSLSDAGFDEAAYRTQLAANPLGAGHYHVHRAQLALIAGDAATLAEHAAAAMALLPAYAYHYAAALARLFQALALAERIKTTIDPQARAALCADMDACRDWMAARAADAPMNFQHLSRWMDAERAWAIGDLEAAITQFDVALREVASLDRPWHHAVIAERAGLCHLARDLRHSGLALLAEAHDRYSAWGAEAKAQEMARAHAFARSAHKASGRGRSSSNSSSITSSGIDLLGILRASQALSSETSMEKLRIRIGEVLRELTGATHLRAVLWYDDTSQWCLPPPLGATKAAPPIPIEEAAHQGLFPLSVFNYVVRTREPLLVDDAKQDDRFANDAYFAAIDCSSLLSVPIFSQGTPRLVLLLENRLSRGAFTAARYGAVMLITGQLLVSLDNARLYASLERKVAERTTALEAANRQLAELSITDALTNLANRRRFDSKLESEWQRAIRPQLSLGLVLIDIDEFKRYNDHYGHQGGDECLRRVADALATSVRGDADLVARYGGEEFVIVLPGADVAATHIVAERARSAVEKLGLPHAPSPHGVVTVSLGIAAAVPSVDAVSTSLVERADAALYRAKRNGRNRIEA